MKKQTKFKKNRIAIGADHKGFALKTKIKKWLLENNFKVIDVGTENVDRVDYPVYAEKVAHLLQIGKADWGVLCCHTGIGMTIAANRFRLVRAVNDSCDLEKNRLSREHNDANVIAFGAGFITSEHAIEHLFLFLNSVFQQLPRYLIRNQKIDRFKKFKKI